MIAEELRIGNFLLFENESQEVSSIHSDSTIRLKKTKCDKCHGCYHVDAVIIKPIPITVEWLLKLGFKYHAADKNYVITTQKDWHNSIKEIEGYWCYNNDFSDANCYFVRELKYVHQLQNLYYAINEEELICK